MRTPEEARALIASRLRADWARVVVGALGWRSGFALGTSGLTAAAVMAQWESEIFAQRMEWFDFTPVPGVRLETRRVPPAFELPARLVVDDVRCARGRRASSTGCGPRSRSCTTCSAPPLAEAHAEVLRRVAAALGGGS